MSHVSKRLFQHGGDRVGPTLNAVSPDKKSAIVVVFSFRYWLDSKFSKSCLQLVCGGYTIELSSFKAYVTDC